MADEILAKKDWDIKELLKKLEDAGLPVLETGAIKVLNSVFDWVQESIIKSDNKYDDLVLTFLPVMRAYSLKMADKIAQVEHSDDIKQAMSDANEESQKVASNPVQELPLA